MLQAPIQWFEIFRGGATRPGAARRVPEFVGKVSCLATHRRFPPSPLHKVGCCIWATIHRSSHPGQVMAVLESLGWGVFALLLLALLGRSGLSSVLTVWSRPLTTGGSPLAQLRRRSSVQDRSPKPAAESPVREMVSRPIPTTVSVSWSKRMPESLHQGRTNCSA